MVGAGTIPLGAVDQLRAIEDVSAELLDAVTESLVDGNERAARRSRAEHLLAPRVPGPAIAASDAIPSGVARSRALIAHPTVLTCRRHVLLTPTLGIP